MIGIIEYGMGNIQSVANAFEFLTVPAVVVKSPKQLESVNKIVLPGVGAFGEGMKKLRNLGYVQALQEHVIERKKPFLGICLGMQLICKESFEFGRFEGLGWVSACVKKLSPVGGLRIPHVGWNDLLLKRENRIIFKQDCLQDVYFVHSYFVDELEPASVIATCEYGMEFPVALEQDNIFATQFHPEKSQQVGLDILKNFSQVN